MQTSQPTYINYLFVTVFGLFATISWSSVVKVVGGLVCCVVRLRLTDA